MKDMKGIEVFAVGNWNKMPFQSHDLEEMVKAFNALKGVLQPPLKLGHNEQQPIKAADGQFSLGWVTKLYTQGDKLVADFEGVPEIVAKAIDKKLYRKVSIELLMDVRHKGQHFPFVVEAVALLGADLPAVNTLADLSAYLSRDAAEFGAARRASFSAVAGSLKEATMEKKDVQDLVDAAVNPIKEQITAVLEKFQKTVDANTALTTQVRTFEKERTDGAIKAKRERANQALEGLAAGGIITPAQREGFAKSIGVDDDARLTAFDLETFIKSFGATETVGSNGKAAFSKAGAGDKDPPIGDKKTSYTYEEACEALDERTQKLTREKKLSYVAARDQVLSEDETLATAYADGRKA